MTAIDQSGPFDPLWLEGPRNRNAAVDYGHRLMDAMRPDDLPSPTAQLLGVTLVFLSSCHTLGVDPLEVVEQIAAPHAAGFFHPRTAH